MACVRWVSRHLVSRHVVGLLGCALVPAACGDPAEPEMGVSVAVTVTRIVGPEIAETADGPTIRCDVHLRATAAGPDEARWGDATLTWFAGVDRTVPLDTVVLPATEVQASWGQPRISTGDTLQAVWQIGAAIPFGLGMSFSYEPAAGTGRKTTAVHVTCGPEITPGTPPPTVSSLAVHDPGGPLEPGDTLLVDFTARSNVGLWQTAAVLSGPCELVQVFTEQLRRASSRTVRFPIPTSCDLGVHVDVAVFALDAAAQQGDSAVATPYVTGDVTRPTIVLTAPVEGLYFVGDTAVMRFAATDNRRLARVHWAVEPAGVRDSSMVDGQAFAGAVNLLMTSAWLGDNALYVWATDDAGLASDTLVIAAPALRVLPTLAYPVVTATVPGANAGVLVDQPRRAIHLLQVFPDAVVTLDAATLAVRSTLPLPSPALAFDQTPGGDSLVLTMASERALGIVDLQAATPHLDLIPMTTLDSAAGQYPEEIAVTSNHKAFVRLGAFVSTAGLLVEFDLASRAERIRDDAGDSGVVRYAHLGTSGDRTAMVLTVGDDRLQRYDAVADAFGPLRELRSPHPPAVDHTGSLVLVGYDLYDVALDFLRELEPAALLPYALAPAADYAYRADGRGLQRATVVDGRAADRIAFPFPVNRITHAPDGKLVVTIEQPSDASTVVRTVTLP